MAINLAEKYSTKIDEKFKLGAVTTPAVNNDYSFEGVKTVKVYSIPTTALGDYTRSGANRYGTPKELEDSLQELTLTRDRAFTFTIDKGNLTEQLMLKEAGKALARQIDEQVVPEIDIYRLSKIAAGAGTTSAAAAITEKNAYSALLDGQVALTDAKAPLGGRIAYVTPAFYKAIKLDSTFVKASDIAQDMLVKGQVGMVDGVAIIVVPSSYMPTNTDFIITHPVACCAPIKLAEYKIHDNPPGINGALVEGRIYYDAFILANKAAAIYKHIHE